MDSDTKNEAEISQNNPNGIDAGEEILSWETWEFPPVERGRTWYLAIVLIGGLLITYGLWTANPLFSLIILMIGVLMLVNSLQKPKRITIHITTRGIVIGNHFHPYEDLTDFSIIYKPPYSTILYLDFKAWTVPVRAIELEQANPLEIRNALLPVLPENIEREDELLTDLIKKVYKL